MHGLPRGALRGPSYAAAERAVVASYSFRPSEAFPDVRQAAFWLAEVRRMGVRASAAIEDAEWRSRHPDPNADLPGRAIERAAGFGRLAERLKGAVVCAALGWRL